MSDRLRRAIAPAYLLMCIVLGGSGQGIWANVLLQLIAIAIIAFAFLNRRIDRQPLAARRLGVLVALMIGLVVLQLVPLPPALWTALPGRSDASTALTNGSATDNDDDDDGSVGSDCI